jgi:hypothetical protein
LAKLLKDPTREMLGSELEKEKQKETQNFQWFNVAVKPCSSSTWRAVMPGVSLSRVPPPAQEPNFIPHRHLSLNWLEIHILEASMPSSE